MLLGSSLCEANVPACVMCVRRPEISIGYPSVGHLIVRQCLPLSMDLINWLDWLLNELRASVPPRAGVTDMLSCAIFSYGCQGSKLGFLFLPSRYFTN